jgi:hypothetical protein
MALSELRVEIASGNIVKIWDDANPNSDGSHFIEQPFGDHGVAFSSKAQAQAWADDYCEKHMASAIAAEAAEETIEE